jgi:hypothetical protein
MLHVLHCRAQGKIKSNEQHTRCTCGKQKKQHFERECKMVHHDSSNQRRLCGTTALLHAQAMEALGGVIETHAAAAAAAAC